MMQAAKFEGNGRIVIERCAAPVAGPGEVVLRVSACALCGSEIMRPLRQGWPMPPGHEIMGVVEAPGHRLDGRRVVVFIPVFCGECSECRSGNMHLCDTAGLVGWQRPGGYAEAVAVPERCLLEVPDDIEDVLAPLLLDTIGTAAHGVRQAMRVVAPGPALVVGAGPIGLGALLVLGGMGFGPISVVEPGAYRAAAAASFGATVLTAEAAAAALRFPLVIEAAGKDASRQLALETVAPRGAVVQLGESDVWTIRENRAVRRKEFFLIRSFYFPPREFAANCDLLRAGRADYRRLVDAEVGLDGLEALFAAFAAGERLKPLLRPGA
jgi:threonine dehydrogenase-like Zn-dependent dehydrogenase